METYRRFGFDKALLVVTLLLLVVGIVMVFSSSAVLAGVKYQQPLYFLLQQVIGAVAGLILAAVICRSGSPSSSDPLRRLRASRSFRPSC